jgi:hypothetical protein
VVSRVPAKQDAQSERFLRRRDLHKGLDCHPAGLGCNKIALGHHRDDILEQNSSAGMIDPHTIELGCNAAVDAGLDTFTFAKTCAKGSARCTYTYRWNGKERLITSHHSSMMSEKN